MPSPSTGEGQGEGEPEILNPKLQILNKFKIPNFNDQIFILPLILSLSKNDQNNIYLSF